jgi:hypothetical protein
MHLEQLLQLLLLDLLVDEELLPSRRRRAGTLHFVEAHRLLACHELLQVCEHRCLPFRVHAGVFFPIGSAAPLSSQIARAFLQLCELVRLLEHDVEVAAVRTVSLVLALVEVV